MNLQEMLNHAHKRAHGLTPQHKNWNDPRWQTEWYFDTEIFWAELQLLFAQQRSGTENYTPPKKHDYCLENWPECEDGKYDPRCCRFPKSCSCDILEV